LLILEMCEITAESPHRLQPVTLQPDLQCDYNRKVIQVNNKRKIHPALTDGTALRRQCTGVFIS